MVKAVMLKTVLLHHDLPAKLLCVCVFVTQTADSEAQTHSAVGGRRSLCEVFS